MASALPGKLSDAGVTGDTAEPVLDQKEVIGQGLVPVGQSMPPELIEAVADASHAAFMSGLHTAMWVGVGVALVGRGDSESGPAHIGL